MLEDIMKSTYTAQDCAVALQHGSFSRWRRDLTRSNALLFPRKTSSGPGGGEYRYAHIFEMAVHLAVSNRRTPIGRNIVGGLTWLLMGNGYGLKKLNAMTDEARRDFWRAASNFEDADFPTYGPREFASFVEAPHIYLGSDFISRDVNAPTWLIFKPSFHENRLSTEVELIDDMKLSEVRKRVFKLLSRDVSATDWRFMEIIDEECDDLPVLNLTSVLSRVDARLKRLLAAKTIRE